MQQTIDKFFNDASDYLGGLDPKRTASMRRIFSKVCRDFNIGPDDEKRSESLALVILCTTKDDECEEEVYEIAHRWMSYLASSQLKYPFDQSARKSQTSER